MKLWWMSLIIVFACFSNSWADIQLGEIPVEVELNGKAGGRLDGTPWNSGELAGKVSVIFYVDPDEKDLNNETSEALKEKKFSLDKFQSLGIINMRATCLPNFAISKVLKKKQKQYPTTVYVRDYNKTLVNKWGIGDDTSDILAFDKKGRLIFRKDGKLSKTEIRQLIEVIGIHLDE